MRPLILVLGIAALAACGPTRPPCSETSCVGCCDTTSGLCVTVTSATQCGARGQSCRSCFLGQSCVGGVCNDNAGSGQAGGGTSGVGGGFVTAGGAGGGSAVGGGSVAGGSAVGGGSVAGGAAGGGAAGGASGGSCPGTCQGCCDATGACRPGSVDTQCGGGGQQCEPCRGAQRCEIFRFCRDSACAGCIDPSGACVTGASNAACGASGLLCRTCRTGESCSNGLCVASACAGCRFPNGTCWVGNELFRCGANGATCSTCATECRNNACVGVAVDAGVGGADAGFLQADDAGFVRVGHVTPFMTDTAQPANIAYGYAMAIPERLALTHLAVFGRSQGSNIRFALYEDFFGTPTRLVASTPFATLGFGPVEVPLITQVSVDAGTYWILGAVDVATPIGVGPPLVTERLFTIGPSEPFPSTFPTNNNQRLNSERNFYVVGRR